MKEDNIKSKEISNLFKNFEKMKNITKEEVEYWFARDLQVLLEYKSWRDFNLLIDKSKISCQNSGAIVDNHFVVQHKMVDIGSGANREIEDYMLDRYACYLIAMNGSSSKSSISFAQTYFAVQTRKIELIQKRIADRERIEAREKLKESETALSKVVYEKGFKDNDFALMRSKGDEALFGMSTLKMKLRLGVKKGRPLADFTDTVIIKAKDLAAAMTAYNVREKDLFGIGTITNEHVENNNSVRSSLQKRGIEPSDVPPKEDIEIVKRRLKKEENTDIGIVKNVKFNNTKSLLTEETQNKEIKISISKDLWKYALYIMYKKKWGIVTIDELRAELPLLITIPKEYMEISEIKKEPKFFQIVRNLKSNSKNKTSLISRGYASSVKNGFQITPKGIEFTEKYFKDFI